MCFLNSTSLLYLPVDEVDEADDDEQHQYADSTSNQRRVARCAVCKQHTLVAVSVCVTGLCNERKVTGRGVGSGCGVMRRRR